MRTELSGAESKGRNSYVNMDSVSRKTMEKRELTRAILRSLALALVFTLIFGVLAIISPSGYRAQARVYSVDEHYELYRTSDYVFAVVSYNCNASFNPLLYPFSWLVGRGYTSGNFSMIYLPYWMTQTTPQGEEYRRPYWGKSEDIQKEATMKIVLEEFLLNLPILPAVFFAIALIGRRSVYVWFLGGTVGFAFGSLIGTLAGFLFGAFLTIVLLPKLRGQGKSKAEAVVSQATEI